MERESLASFVADGALGEFAQAVEDAGIGTWIGRKFFFEEHGVEGHEEGVHLRHCDAQAGDIERRTV